MIVTLTPNTAIDITYTVEGFGLDRVHRPSEVRTVAGGKGINVARVLKTLGNDAIATGFVGGKTGDSILEKISAEGLSHDFVRVKGDSRLCIAIVDPKTGTQTEINENGPEILGDELASMLEKVKTLIEGRKYVVLCGSCPPGVPTSFYGDIISLAKKAGAVTILDASGAHLSEALKSGPYMVKPNLTELAQLAGREMVTLEEIVASAKSLKQFGVKIMVVTMGKSGAVVTDGVQAWMAVSPEIKFASAVGSGDSFMAAFIHSMAAGQTMPDALTMATAAGAANAATYGAGFCSKESIMDLCASVSIQKLDL
ncbi:MAG: 1-phosphofructokinase [Armatimonadetes bacterium]|nr:1-phosphofructokinase [Armatimonadota bacterium]